MSYTITVRSHGGELEVTHTGEVPDGEHVISGHEDEHARSVSVQRNHAEGHHLATAATSHRKEH